MKALKSMTGFGAARCEVDGQLVAVEVRAVNGRFLKCHVKVPPVLAAAESEVEAVVRRGVRRGTVSVHVLMEAAAGQAVHLDAAVVNAYKESFAQLGLPLHVLPLLAGVTAGRREAASEAQVDAVLACVGEAVDNLDAMRCREGAALGGVLYGLCARLQANRDCVREQAPTVVQAYAQKLQARIDALLAASGTEVALDAATLAREVALFADRCDVTEELDRLATHLQEANKLIAGGGEVGRTLEFLAQEMLREINTTGAKSADAGLSHRVVEMKADVERLKEQVANVE